MSKYLPEDWVRWRIDRALDQARAEFHVSRDDYDTAENIRAFQVLRRLQDDIEDGPVRTERQIFEDYRGPEKETRQEVHARWKPVVTVGGAGFLECSQCGYKEHDHVKYTRFSFCPNCGAQMDGKEEETT